MARWSPQDIPPINIGALHIGTETKFTGSGSPIRIQCCLVWAPQGMHTICVRALHCWTGTHTLSGACSTQLGSRSRLCGGKVVFQSGSPIHIQGPVWRAPLLMVLMSGKLLESHSHQILKYQMGLSLPLFSHKKCFIVSNENKKGYRPTDSITFW